MVSCEAGQGRAGQRGRSRLRAHPAGLRARDPSLGPGSPSSPPASPGHIGLEESETNGRSCSGARAAGKSHTAGTKNSPWSCRPDSTWGDSQRPGAIHPRHNSWETRSRLASQPFSGFKMHHPTAPPGRAISHGPTRGQEGAHGGQQCRAQHSCGHTELPLALLTTSSPGGIPQALTMAMKRPMKRK